MIVKYANSLTNYRDSRINLYQGLYDQLNDILTQSNNYVSNLTAFTTTLTTF